MKRITLIGIAGLFLTACVAVRSMQSKSITDIDGINVCLSKSELARKIGSPDDSIAIPGGGRIEIHDVLIRPDGIKPAGGAVMSVLTLGIVDLTSATSDLIYDCQGMASKGLSGFGSKCDYKKLRFFAHYTDANTQQMSCIEKKEVWAGGGFYSSGDMSKCPTGYKTKLSELIDTSDFPEATLPAPAIDGTVFEQLQLMAADHRANC